MKRVLFVSLLLGAFACVAAHGMGIMGDADDVVRGARGAQCVGPCEPGSACGNGDDPTGLEGCEEDATICDGKCTTTCPHGSDDKFCVGTGGSCDPRMVSCSQTHTHKCRVEGTYGCTCYDSGLGSWCSRQTC